MVPALTEPTRSYIDGTPTQRRLGFVAASIFSATYVIAPVYLLVTGVTLVRAKRPLAKEVWLLTLPLIASALIPARILPKFGRWLLQTKFMACVPYYFEYEEFHVRSRRFEVLRCLHFIQTTRAHLTMTWVVSFPILMLRAGNHGPGSIEIARRGQARHRVHAPARRVSLCERVRRDVDLASERWLRGRHPRFAHRSSQCY